VATRLTAPTPTRTTTPLCGDIVRMELKIDDQGTMREVYFNGEGCCISQAAASMLVERFDGRTVEEVKKVHRQRHAGHVWRPPDAQRQKCCLLPVAGVASGHFFAGEP